MGCLSIPGLHPRRKFAGTHLYTWVERGTVKVKRQHNVPAQDSNPESSLQSQPPSLRVLKQIVYVHLYDKHRDLSWYTRPLLVCNHEFNLIELISLDLVCSKENCPNLTFLDVSGTNIRAIHIEKLQVCSLTKDGTYNKSNHDDNENRTWPTFFETFFRVSIDNLL